VIAVVYGTTGELIKFAPVCRRLEQRGDPLLRISTGQQVEQIPTMLADFGLADVDLWLARGHRGGDLEQPRHLPRWFADVCVNFLRSRRAIAARLRSDGLPPLLIVHGDTMTTVIGAALGRMLRVPVAHIEAGLRTGNWRRPFPEELNRRAAAKLARIHYAPGPQAVRNLRAERVRGEIVDTGLNTIADSLREMPAEPLGFEPPADRFGIVSLHRQELLYNRELLTRILAELKASAGEGAPLLFIDHPITAAAVEAAGLGDVFDGERFVRIPRMRYFQFLSLLKSSAFLVTDSGGSQEECAFLGHPCLLLRTVTEREMGLDGPVVLSGMDTAVIRRFMADPERHRTEPPQLAITPSDRIVEHLASSGFVRRPANPALMPAAGPGEHHE
jgi:UDP-N-acetylglucosamine 2-epimerase (non-hydrolysing)